MRLRTYFAETLSQALQQIRKDMGADAIIVSSIKEGHGVRVTAAVEMEMAQPAASSSVTVTSNTSLVNPVETVNTLCRWFDQHHVSSESADLLAAKVSMVGDSVLAQGVAATLGALFPTVPLLPHVEAHNPTRLVLIGTPGAGKSVAAAKLASEYLVAGNKNVKIISTDAVKSGADRQLAAYAEALNIPFGVYEKCQDVQKALGESPPDQIVIVDTPGISPYADDDITHLQQTLDVVQGRAIQVLPAGMDPYEASDTSGFLYDLGAQILIHTRVDTVRRLAGLLHMLASHPLIPMAFGMGPELGDRLRPATGEMLAQILQEKLSIVSPRQGRSRQEDQAPRWRFEKGELA